MNATPKEQAEIATQVDDDAVRLNELNQEPWWQSGVGIFGSGGAVWALGVILTQVGEHGVNLSDYNHMTMITAGGALVSTVGVLYRRFWPGLKPMFHWLT